MALVLGAGAYCEWLKAMEIVAVLGFSEGQARSLATQEINDELLATQHSLFATDANRLRSLSQLLAQHPQRRVILLYADLPLALTAMVQQSDQPIKDALNAWQENLALLQDFYRSHRDQTLLFELGQVLNYPESFLQVCATEWQYGLPSHLSSLSVDSLAPDESLIGLAQQLLQEQPQLKQQQLYTQAMTWPLDNGTDNVVRAPSSAYELLAQKQAKNQIQRQLHQDLANQKRELNELKQENALTLEQLLLIQENLEKQLLIKEDLQKQLETWQVESAKKEQAHSSQLEEQRRLLTQAQQQVTELSTSKSHLARQLDQLKVDYEAKLRVHADAVAKEKTDTPLHHETQRLVDQAQLQVVELTKAKEALTQENQLVIEQLLVVQEELEQRILAEKAALKRLTELQDLRQENGLLVQQLHQTQEALEAMHLQQVETTVEQPVAEQMAESPSRDVVVVSDLRVHAPDHTVPPRSFFERRAHKKVQRLARRKDCERAAQIAQTPWFDAAWYLEQYPDIASDPTQSQNPALHYIRMGGFEGRNPSPHFDSAFYLATNPDVFEAGLNPLWHFIQNGQAEGRQPQP